MGKFSKIIPEGTRDYLFSACAVRGMVAKNIGETFKNKGYFEVETPSIEYYDVYDYKKGAIPQEDTYKLTDNDGRLLVLRPDCTMPIARIVSTRFKNAALPIKLYYTQNVFRMNASKAGRRNEIRQSGVELVGCGGIRADIDIISCAVASLKNLGLDFKLEIGHVGIFSDLAECIGLKPGERERLRSYVEHKNYAAIAALTGSLDCDKRYSRLLSLLPETFGRIELLEEYAALAAGTSIEEKAKYLLELYNTLVSMGYGEYIGVDLGFVHHMDYYTGIIFRGYADGAGEPVLSGGRYDDLLGMFDFDCPATGFAINVDAVAELLQSRGLREEDKIPDAVIHYERGYAAKAYRLLGEGSYEISVCETLEETRRYAEAKKIKKIIVLGAQGHTETEV